MAFNAQAVYGAGSPHVNSTNPFEKYKTARDEANRNKNTLSGMLGIGTGSYDRYSTPRRSGERRKITRVIVFGVLCGLVYWFFIYANSSNGPSPSVANIPVPEALQHTVQSPETLQETVAGTILPEGAGPAVVAHGEPLVLADEPEHEEVKQVAEIKPVDPREQVGKENASFVMLVRNGDLKEALKSMRQIEDRFNRVYKYPWTFLNEVEFTEEFKKETTKMASGKTEYGFIKAEEWGVPESINKTKMEETLAWMKEKNIIYGDSVPYRHMCRYNSGFFWRHELVMKYDWYWRVEPSIGFFCTVEYDIFEFMRTNNKKYGFVQTLPEYAETITTLWPETLKFVKENPHYLAKNHSLQFLLTDDTPENATMNSEPAPQYNRCHFWSNFEVGDLRFWRGEAYTKYFEHLDKAGGFYYERWGDAPVHSLAVSLFLDTEQVHHFADLGYFHAPWGRCPQPDEFHNTAKCVCPFEKEKSFDIDPYSCQPRWWKIAGKNYGT